jgi:hypothetical protein
MPVGTIQLLMCKLSHLCCAGPAGATLLSFVVALVHFVTELLVFKTMSIKGAATPMIIAGKCHIYWLPALVGSCRGTSASLVAVFTAILQDAGAWQLAIAYSNRQQPADTCQHAQLCSEGSNRHSMSVQQCMPHTAAAYWCCHTPAA